MMWIWREARQWDPTRSWAAGGPVAQRPYLGCTHPPDVGTGVERFDGSLITAIGTDSRLVNGVLPLLVARFPRTSTSSSPLGLTGPQGQKSHPTRARCLTGRPGEMPRHRTPLHEPAATGSRSALRCKPVLRRRQLALGGRVDVLALAHGLLLPDPSITSLPRAEGHHRRAFRLPPSSV
jgi:hypothetical protein